MTPRQDAGRYDDREPVPVAAGPPRPDPMERRIAEAGKAIGAWYKVNAGRILAALLHDSTARDAPAVCGPSPGAPVPGTPRSLVFASGRRRVEVRLSHRGVEGRLDPPAPGPVRLLDGTGPIAETTADATGRFTFPARRRGVFRVECPAGDGRRVATEWITA